MLLRMSTLFLRTLREDPADADVDSHRLLVRAGYIRRAAPGAYTFLPLGKLVIDNVARVVREEMAAIGAQEVSFPSLLPREPYQASGRWQEYGPEMFRLRDRRGAEYLLAPTHEEMFTLLVRDLYASYRDYPVILYQIQTKFRDERRPRAGLLRGREFLMKDSYSFDLDEAGLAESYGRHRAAYQRIFDRLGLETRTVTALAGAMGGSVSEEFLAVAAVGEDTFVACAACGYAANTEAVVTMRDDSAGMPDRPSKPDRPSMSDRTGRSGRDQPARPPSLVIDTPGTPTIDSLVQRLNASRVGGRQDWTAGDTLKNVVFKIAKPGEQAPEPARDVTDGGDATGELLVIGLPGDREVDPKRLDAAVYPATASPAEAGDFSAHPELVRGYIGPQRLRDLGVRYLVDPRVVPGTAWVTGANEPDRHAIDVVCGRDFIPDGTIEVAEIRPGDPCPSCGAGLGVRRGVEVGHIFQLGRRYADALGLDALGPDGRHVPITMGSYGIGLSRVVAAVAEQHHDERGLSWPREVAPADVHVVPAGTGPQLDAALELAEALRAKDLRVLVDDRRSVSAGVKFADAELIGIPVILVVGRRLSDGYVEVRDRAAGARQDVPLAEIPGRLAANTAGRLAAGTAGNRVG